MVTFFKLSRPSIGLTLPALAILLVVFGIPMVLLLLTSFDAPAFTLANYQAFVDQPANLRVLSQTAEMSLVATALCVGIGYPTAYLIAASSKQLRATLIGFVVISYLTSLLARTYALVLILGDRGLINNFLIDVGLISSPLPLIYNRTAVYIGMVQIMLPVMVLPLISVMVGIDKSLMAAARSMGARPFTAFRRVFFPLSLPGVRSGSVLVFVLCLGFYITPAALGGVRDTMLSTFIAAQLRSSLNLGSTAASSLILLAIAMIVISLIGLDLSGSPSRTPQPVRKTWRKLLPSSEIITRYLNELAGPYRAKQWTARLYRAGADERWSKVAGATFVALVMLFLLFPGLVVIIMSFSPGTFLEFPPSGLSLQWYRSFFGDASWYDATWTSVQIGIAVTILSTIVGTLAAYGLSHTYPRLRTILSMVILTPITFPVIVVGIATYLGLVQLGLIGTKAGIILAHSIGATGYVVVIVSATLANLDRRLEDAAKSMRAGPFQTFMRVTLPLIRPGVIGGAVFAFLHSFDEVVTTSLVGGLSIRTLPLKMWENMRHQLDPTIAAVASLLMLLPVLWLIVLYVTWWKSRPQALRAIQDAPQ
ncbi:ABC transporter permease subunit [Rhizobium laguerreae]|uniref:ABC transporter permease subunit n=1 Tax=Rhizobium laguerreae TaxID=1076926 RepID=UPI001C909D57|nr:ABC transporter permease subunit [Rhizobium laguerreae]MBY3328944.1 ABC transporter permease subunit [Rhizobium laguerreae]